MAAIFKRIFLNEKVRLLTKISLNLVHTGSIDANIGLDNGLAPNRRQAII